MLRSFSRLAPNWPDHEATQAAGSRPSARVERRWGARRAGGPELARPRGAPGVGVETLDAVVAGGAGLRIRGAVDPLVLGEVAADHETVGGIRLEGEGAGGPPGRPGG